MAPQISALRVLVIDDNAHMRHIVATLLRAIGVSEVEECADGAQGLDAVRNGRVDVAIVDLQMSPLNGVEFTQLVRQATDSANPFLPIIMLTAHAERERVEEARDAGVYEFIIKPVTAQAIINRLNMIINKPRPFVRTADYFGPDRRRRSAADYDGPRRRKDDPPPDPSSSSG